MTIRVTDLNYGGHLGNDSVLSICHEARLRFLKDLSYTELDIEGSGIIMADAAIQYKGEGFYGDEMIIEIGITDFTKMGCDFVYRLTNKETRKIIALVKTGIVFYDYNLRNIMTVPDKFKSTIDSTNS
jgi:acyl-CoA thioesterase FadM